MADSPQHITLAKNRLVGDFVSRKVNDIRIPLKMHQNGAHTMLTHTNRKFPGALPPVHKRYNGICERRRRKPKKFEHFTQVLRRNQGILASYFSICVLNRTYAHSTWTLPKAGRPPSGFARSPYLPKKSNISRKDPPPTVIDGSPPPPLGAKGSESPDNTIPFGRNNAICEDFRP